MDFVFLQEGAKSFLNVRLNQSWAVGGKGLKVKLYTNTVSLVETLEASDFTEVLSESGYAAHEILIPEEGYDRLWEIRSWPVGWVANAYVEARCTVPAVFAFSGPLTDALTVKGYFVTDADDVALWAYEFTTAYAPEAGIVISFFPKLTSYAFSISVAGLTDIFNARLNDVWPEYGPYLTMTVFATENSYPPMPDQILGGDPSMVMIDSPRELYSGWSAGSFFGGSQETLQFYEPISSPSGGYIHGYYLTNSSGAIFAAKTFDGSYQPDNGDNLHITPYIELKDGPMVV